MDAMDMGGSPPMPPMDMGAGAPPHDHAAHAHAAAGGMAMAMDTGVLRRADGSYYYSHGAWLGHVVPGYFFMALGLWWFAAVFARFLRAAAGGRPFRARPWEPVWFGPAAARRFPLEPALKVLFPALGALGEVWFGHGQFLWPFADDGKFVMGNINNWQHAAMYAAFIVSGAVDLAGAGAATGPLPPGTETAFLALAFAVEGTLLGFHLKGPQVEVRLHLILVIQVFLTAVSALCEIRWPRSFLVACLRPWLTVVQGVWWVQTARVMFLSAPAWDPEYMGSGMMVPVLFVVHALWVAAAALGALLLARALLARRLGRELSLADEFAGGGGGGKGGGEYVPAGGGAAPAVFALGDDDDVSPVARGHAGAVELAAVAEHGGANGGARW